MANELVTIRDVALQAGVSVSTVSRVLSGSETRIPISQETRERVRKVAKELGYRPHPSARALSGKGTNLLGLIVRQIDDPFFAELIEVIGGVAKEEGYDLVLGNAESDPEEALALRDMMLALRYCDGFLLCGDLQESPEDHSLLVKMETGHPMVSVCRGSRQLVGNTPSVSIDNRKGTFLALDYLAQLGHRRIACMDVGRVGDLRERLEAYQDFMEDRFGGFPVEYVQSAENSYEGGYKAAEQLLSLPSPPTAIFAVDDVMAIGALSAAFDMRVGVPRELSVVGFDDLKVSAHVRPALTTVRQPVGEMGRETVELLLRLIRKELELDSCPQFLLEPGLAVRDSCAPPP